MGSPNMNLTIPGVLTEPGPTYAQDVNDDLTKIDAHDHSGGGTGGKVLGTNALSIDADLPLNGFNATSVRAERFNDNTTPVGGDVRAIYVSAGDLYYNNNSGAAVRITNGTALNTGVTSTILNGVPVTNVTIAPSDPYTLYQVNSSGGAIAITLPTAASVGRGRWYVFVDLNQQASVHAITISKSGSDTVNGGSSISIVDQGGGVMVFTDGVSIWNAYHMFASDATFGTLAAQATSVTSLTAGSAGSPATTGDIRLRPNCSIKALNAGSTGDIPLASCDGSDNLIYGSGSLAASCTMTAKSGGTVTCSVSSGGSVAIGTSIVLSTGVGGACTVGSGSATASMIATTCTIAPGNGTARLQCTATGVGFYGTSPVGQASRAGQLTDSTGGTPGSTLASFVGTTWSTDSPTVKNTISSMAQRINALETIIHNLGLSA